MARMNGPVPWTIALLAVRTIFPSGDRRAEDVVVCLNHYGVSLPMDAFSLRELLTAGPTKWGPSFFCGGSHRIHVCVLIGVDTPYTYMPGRTATVGPACT